MSDIHEYHQKQYQAPYRSTVRLMELVEKTCGRPPAGKILDAACGGGANVHHPSQRWPQAEFTGVDSDPALIDYAQARARETPQQRCQFLAGDLFALSAQFAPRSFEVVTFLQTLFLFDLAAYPRVLQNLIGVARHWVFISSLFADSNMDVVSRLYDYTRFGEGTGRYFTYVILDQNRFAETCGRLGAREVIFEDFWIDIDLPQPPEGGIGTFTRRDAEGRRLQFSGAQFMPWKFAALRME